MLRVVSHKSAAAASQYYSKGLKREDYYSQGQEVAGKWHGKAAELLNLSGQVTPDEFAALVENRHPGTGEKLTPRVKDGRIVGYDINFHAPKSLSLLQALTGDKAIVDAFRDAVTETMTEIEGQISTRVRVHGAQENRVTGNMAWAEFVHFTSRPVGGIPDPHLHVHCFAFNATFDETENRWKAANFRDIKTDAPYSEAAFHARLADKIAALGYGIARTRVGWEVAGISRELVDRFSRRTAQIERLAAEKGITNAKQKDGLAAASREGKRHGLTHEDLMGAWNVRLTNEDRELIAAIHEKRSASQSVAKISAKEAVDHAIEKLFAKNSVVEANRIIAEAMRYGVGHVLPNQIWQEFGKRDVILRRFGNQNFCTTKDILLEEISMIQFVRSGRGTAAPFVGKNYRPEKSLLSNEQQSAVRHILRSRDQVIAVRGGAGVGKTTLMKEAVTAIEISGQRVYAFAPSAAASRETLREAGFGNAETVAHLLTNKKLQEQIRGQVIWIDEAGLLGVRDMWQIMQLAGDSTRIILTGDTAQHAPVARGDAFRLLQRFAGLRIAEVKEIRRQEGETYRNAVSALSKSDLRTGFRRLDEMGAIYEIADDAERYWLLALDYIETSRTGSPPLVVSPTHAESANVTQAIREAKREARQLGPEKAFLQYRNLQWEVADRKNSGNYTAGLVVQFHQNCTDIKRSELLSITGHDEKGRVLAVNSKGREVVLPLEHADRFLVYEQREIQLAKGDQIRITRNGESSDGKRLNNGNVFSIAKIGKSGEITLNNGAVLDAKHGHINYGYCQTSHSSQSKSVRDVLVAQSAESFRAGSTEQFYVSVSRAKQSIRIYTDDRGGLQKAVGNSSQRRAGLELAGLTKDDLSAMSTELNSKQWRDTIRSRQAEGKGSHVENLLKQRRDDGLKKGETVDFRQYVAMRRQLAGADGKNRSKGHPSAEPKQGGAPKTKGKSFIRPTSLTDATKKIVSQGQAKRPAAAPEQAKPPAIKTVASQRESRLTKAYQSSVEHFKKVAAKGKKAVSSIRRPKVLPESNIKTLVNHSIKRRKADAGGKAKTKSKIQAKAKTAAPKPPTPAPRRGK